MTVRTRHRRFNEFIFLIDLLMLIDYWILKLPFKSVACTFVLFSELSYKSFIYQKYVIKTAKQYCE